MFYDRSTKWYGEHEETVTKSFFFIYTEKLKKDAHIVGAVARF